MRILLLDVGGNFLDFALRCAAHGHTVRWFIAPGKNGERLPVGDGLIEKVKEWQKWVGLTDLVITADNTRYMSQLEPFRKLGCPIFGPNVKGAEMELNRTLGQKVWKDAGVPIMDYKTFTSYDDAIRFVEKNAGKRWVSKPSGDADKALSYVSKHSGDMIEMLRRWKKKKVLAGPFILQEFQPGIEVAVGGWFGPHGWSSQFNINFEHKKHLNDDLGCNTGEQGTVIYYTDKEKLAEKVLLPISPYLESIGYTGYIDVAVIIDKDGNPWPLEFTARPGWPHFQIITSLHEGDPVEWILDLMRGYDTLQVKKGVCTGVVVTMPDFPYNKLPRENLTGIPIYCDQNEHIHPCEIMAGVAAHVVGNKVIDLPTWVSAGNYLLVVTGIGNTVSASAKKAYEVIDGISIPNSPGYRTDIGKRLQKELPELHRLGYCKTLSY
jgi:phosphoribosylamine--glycine ligase